MPNLTEIAEFREELKNIAQEPQITEAWGEPVYDELPAPEAAPVPDIDFDSLLSAADIPDLQPAANEPAPDALESELPEISAASPSANIEEIAGTEPDDSDGFSSDLLGDLDLTDMPADFGTDMDMPDDDAGFSVDSNSGADFDDFLSSLDLDSGTADTDIPEDFSEFGTPDSDSPELSADKENISDSMPVGMPAGMPESEPEFLSEEPDELTGEPTLNTERDIDSMLADYDFGTNAEFPDTNTEFNTDDFSVDESSFPAFDAMPQSDTESEPDILSAPDEMSVYSEERGGYEPEAADAPMPISDASESADGGIDFPDMDFSGLDTGTSTKDSDYEEQDAASPDTHTDPSPQADLDNGFDPLGGFGSLDDIPLSSSENNEDEENQGHNGFALDDNVLDTGIAEVTDDQFNLPDNFKDFSSDSRTGSSFDSVIAKSTGSSESDSLSIDDDAYFYFLNRLESFPLNVQLAIQDYIGNGEDSQENKMEFIKLIIANTSLKKVVRKLEKILDKSIPIPRGFERKSVEEYEREKKTFKYWFMQKFLPVAVMTGFVLIFTACIGILSWHFIYKPITSESLYKTGYTYIMNGQYEPAIDKFDEAGTYKRKKKWYFAYARAFRSKKQFTAAEKMYNRLLLDFEYDKAGGLEYADMLTTELRNYEKAERILQRTLLDHHLNDSDGLLALGDVYMSWAEEDPAKYDDAVKTYSRLIELYGDSDLYLSRMLRYFIRTDNLAEVLPLEEHFLTNLSKLSPADLTELSGYLLEKRYTPKPLDSEKLRQRIDDVRFLLEKAVQADKNMPEAYYNLGRFFIYNYKPEAAFENLTQAVQRFENAPQMPPRRIIQHIDSMRLLGELLVNQKKFLDAQDMYADALSIYREYTAIKPLPPNKIVGKLYQDYGDIDYFISHNFDSALASYQNALRELNNTPTLHYRIGYIHYKKENYPQAIQAMSLAYAEKPDDKNLLYGFGNTLFKRGDYFAAQAYYQQLMDLLDLQRVREGKLYPNTRLDDAAFIEEYMHASNNLATTLNRLSDSTGDSQKNARALALYSESTRAWDALTRNPDTLIRSKSVGLAYLNIQNMVNPKTGYKPEIYTDIAMTLQNEKILQQKEDK
ncbi:MAG: periplasmic flagellar collar protein FlcA [Treponema sp.]